MTDLVGDTTTHCNLEVVLKTHNLASGEVLQKMKVGVWSNRLLGPALRDFHRHDRVGAADQQAADIYGEGLMED